MYAIVSAGSKWQRASDGIMQNELKLIVVTKVLQRFVRGKKGAPEVLVA